MSAIVVSIAIVIACNLVGLIAGLVGRNSDRWTCFAYAFAVGVLSAQVFK